MEGLEEEYKNGVMGINGSNFYRESDWLGEKVIDWLNVMCYKEFMVG